MLFVVMGLLLAVYMTALYKMQIFSAAADEDAMLAKNTTTKTVTLTADRGRHPRPQRRASGVDARGL